MYAINLSTGLGVVQTFYYRTNSDFVQQPYSGQSIQAAAFYKLASNYRLHLSEIQDTQYMRQPFIYTSVALLIQRHCMRTTHSD